MESSEKFKQNRVVPCEPGLSPSLCGSSWHICPKKFTFFMVQINILSAELVCTHQEVISKPESESLFSEAPFLDLSLAYKFPLLSYI